MHCEVEPPCTRFRPHHFGKVAICALIVGLLAIIAGLAHRLDAVVEENVRLRTGVLADVIEVLRTVPAAGNYSGTR